MKILYPVFAFAISIGLLFACTRDDNFDPLFEEIAYPRKFVYQDQEFVAPVYYEVGSGGFSEVAPNENFSFIKDTVEQLMQYEWLEFPFKEFNFLSDSTVEVGFEFEPGNLQHVSTSYTNAATLMSLDIGLAQPLVLKRDLAFNEAEACLKGYYYSYFNTFFQERRISASTIDLCAFELEDVDSLLETIVEDYGLEVGDTIALHKTYLRYVLD